MRRRPPFRAQVAYRYGRPNERRLRRVRLALEDVSRSTAARRDDYRDRAPRDLVAGLGEFSDRA